MSISNATFSLQNNNSPYSRGMVLLLVFYSLISATPIFPALGLHGRHLLVFVIIGTLLISLFNKRGLKKWLFPVAGLLFIPAIIPAIFWSDPRLVFLPLFLFVPILLLAQSTHRELSRYIDYATWFLLVMLVGAVVGYFIARSGIEPLSSFPNPDARLNYYFYTTLTNVYQGNYIRPSGIYDEPGALSFFVCAIAFARQKAGRNVWLTWVLLGLGLITFSLMHLVYIAFFLMSEKISVKWMLKMALALCIFFAAMVSTGLGQAFGEKLLSRLEINESGQIAGDNRSEMMLNAINTLKTVEHAWLVGVDVDCTFDVVQCKNEWGAMIANPLDPLVSQGILLSWPYYILIALTCIFALQGRKNFTFFAIGLLFVQRPYVLVLGYSFMAVLALWLQFSRRAVVAPHAMEEIHFVNREI